MFSTTKEERLQQKINNFLNQPATDLDICLDKAKEALHIINKVDKNPSCIDKCLSNVNMCENLALYMGLLQLKNDIISNSYIDIMNNIIANDYSDTLTTSINYIVSAVFFCFTGQGISMGFHSNVKSYIISLFPTKYIRQHIDEVTLWLQEE